jgi:hypothetical protein
MKMGSRWERIFFPLYWFQDEPYVYVGINILRQKRKLCFLFAFPYVLKLIGNPNGKKSFCYKLKFFVPVSFVT